MQIIGSGKFRGCFLELIWLGSTSPPGRRPWGSCDYKYPDSIIAFSTVSVYFGRDPHSLRAEIGLHRKLYLKSKGFLHFHMKDDRRWADVRDGASWGSEIDLPFDASASQKKKFLNVVRQRYKNSLL